MLSGENCFAAIRWATGNNRLTSTQKVISLGIVLMVTRQVEIRRI